MDSVQIKRLEVGSFESNCYILSCPERLDSAIIDPGAEGEKILKDCKGLRVKFILITHGHGDHIGALGEVRDSIRAPVGIHSMDASSLSFPPDILLKDGDSLMVGNLELRVIHTPGHTPGGVCFLIDKYLFSGDTIFPGGPGNTALPRANYSEIINSIWQKIFVLPDDTIIYPGHGLETTVGREKYSGIYGQSK